MPVSSARLLAGGVFAWIVTVGWSAAWFGQPISAAPAPSGPPQAQTSVSKLPAPASAAPAPNAASARQARRSPAQDTGYTGSASCERCHEAEYRSWRQNLHLQMTKPIAEAEVAGDFRPGTHLEAHGRAYAMEQRDGRYFITVTWGSDPPETYRIDYTLGARRFQGYLSTLPDGRIYVLPVFWHNETHRWVDWKETTPVPDDAAHVGQIWNVECVNCHATNLVKNYDVPTNTYDTTWTEMGIGCEACHGLGAPHVAKMDAYAKVPRSLPAYDGSATNRALSSQLAIFSPRTAEPRKVFDTCGYCHGNKNNKFFGFRPGDRFEDFALPFLISEPLPPNDPQGEFFTDGRPSRFNRPQALTLSGCFMRGEITCTTCHTIHGARHDHALKVPVVENGLTTRESDQLCTQCHAEGAKGAPSTTFAGAAGSAVALDREAPGPNPESHATAYGSTAVPPSPIPNLEAHTHHAPGSPGSRCIECHMSNVNWRLFTRRRDHSFQPPVPEMTARFGVANACNACHDDKTPEWAAATMDKWYGDGDRRRDVVEMAEVFYRAGAGDTTVLPQVTAYAVDRRRGALIRASAAEFAAQLLAAGTGPAVPAVVNSLSGAAADPEPMVRAEALHALGFASSPQTVPIVVAHLEDDARVVRSAAAAALFQLGVTRLAAPTGDTLTAAQRDWMASLQTFADVAGSHTTLGWIEAELGQPAPASQELETAVRMDPAAAQPHVYLGVVAARAGRYADALREFEIAKSLYASYTNLDRLIEEAKKRIPSGRN